MIYKGRFMQVTDEIVLQVHNDGLSHRKAARQLGMAKTTYQRRLKRAKKRFTHDNIADPATYSPAPGIELDALPEPGRSVRDIIKAAKKIHRADKARFDAENWQELRLNERKPFAIVSFGDPHMDDRSCNWTQLERDIGVCADTPGMYGINIGDVINNWVGRLEKKYQDQNVTQGEAIQLASWFMNDAGIDWLLWIYGNHDLWKGTDRLIDAGNKRKIITREWDARVVVKLPNGRSFKIHAAHSFKGKSHMNILHGLNKAAKYGTLADLYFDGHTHEWGYMQYELPDQKRFPLVVKSRGYKEMDEYAILNGFPDGEHGHAMTVIVDPDCEGPNQFTAFSDIKKAAQYLSFLRGEK